jgi:sugar phosphate isomerase/epimerase
MELGIFAKTFPRPTLDETLDAVRQHGFSQIQFNMSCMGLPTLPDRLDEASCVWIAQSLHARGLRMAAISGTFNMCDPVDSRIEHNLRRLDVLADACRWLDTRIITLCTGTRHRDDMWKWHADNARKASWDRLVETVREAVKIADRHEVTLAFEPEARNVVSSVMRARRLLDELASPWLKVVIDPVNLFATGHAGHLAGLLHEFFDWLGSDIVLAHVKPPPALEPESESAKRFSTTIRELARGERVETLAAIQLAQAILEGGLEQNRLAGWLDFHFPFIVALRNAGFAGPLIIHGVEESQVGEALALLRRALELLDNPIPGDAAPPV